MAQARVSSGYRIVIPREIREALGIRKGQTVTVMPAGSVTEVAAALDIQEMEGIFSELNMDSIRDESDG